MSTDDNTARPSQLELRSRQTRLARAVQLADRGEHERARSLVQSVLSEDPQYAPALALLERLQSVGGTTSTTGDGSAANAVKTTDSRSPAPQPEPEPAGPTRSEARRRNRQRLTLGAAAAQARGMAATERVSPTDVAGTDVLRVPETTEAALNEEPGAMGGSPVAAPGRPPAPKGSWSQFERRMQLRRETTCAAAMRQAMDAGDYSTALVRAKELEQIDPSSWREMRLLLEERMRAADAPAARRTRAPAAATTSHVPGWPAGDISTVAEAQPRRRRRLPLAVAALALVVLAAFGGWAALREWPWLATSVSEQVADFSPGAPPPVTHVPGTRTEPEIPGLPPIGGESASPPAAAPTSPAPASPSPESTTATSGSTSTEDGKSVPNDEQGASKPAEQRPAPSETKPSVSRDSATAESRPPAAAPQRPLTPPASQTLGSKPVSSPATTSKPTDSATSQASPATQTQMQASPPVTPPTAPSYSTPPSTTGSNTASGNAAASPPSTASSAAASTASSAAEQPPTPPTQTSTSGTSTAAGTVGSSSPTTRPDTGTSTSSALPSATGGDASSASSEARYGTHLPSPSASAAELDEQRAINRTLNAYQQGYTAMDASAVRRVWPRVNADALRHAFGQLDSQRVSFAGCSIDVRGLHAAAICRGTATYVPKVGSGSPVSMERTWEFALRKFGDSWLIDAATSR